MKQTCTRTLLALLCALALAVPAFAAAETAPPAQDSAALDGAEDFYVPDATSETAVEDGAPAAVPDPRQPGRGSIDDIARYWDEHGWPDQVAYAFQVGGAFEDGQALAWWEIGIVGGDDALRQEILELASPTCLVEFRSSLFTHAEKCAAYDRLLELAAEDGNIQSVVFGLNTDTVWVGVPDELAKDYAQYLIRDCGLGAVVSVTDSRSMDVIFDGDFIDSVDTAEGAGSGVLTTGIDGGQTADPRPALWLCAALAVAVLAVWALLLRRHGRTAVAAAVSGPDRQISGPIGRSQAVAILRESAVPPDGRVLRSILEELER